MRVWGKTPEGRRHTAGVARAAVEGKGQPCLLKEAVQTLLASGADRVGVWVGSSASSSDEAGQIISFRGIVADKEMDSTPAEWSRLSPEPPLPQELLVGLQTVEQELAEPPEGLMIGALIEMRRVLWVPLILHGHLRGVLFAGQRKKQAHLPRALLESVAAELALALELEDERRLRRERQEDSNSVSVVLAALAGPALMGDILTDILQGCTRQGAHESGPAAIFAAIGRPLEPPRKDFSPQGKGGTIRVKTKRIAENRVLLEVSDDGPGIPQAIQARIFDPFFTTKPAGVGTGLGLAIVLGIVREHGGKLHLASKIGQNTVFSIEFPAAAVEMPLPAIGDTSISRARLQALPVPESLETVHAGATLAAWAGTRVLVLEDEPTVARLIADVLEDEGLRVDVLLDAREALDRAEHVAYALAICDMKMPELDGEHFYLALARAKNPLHQHFLFVTGDVLAAHTRDFLERYHLPHVAKPFRVEELTDKIRGVLEGIPPFEPSRALAAKKNAARK